jgi:SAM-dependent methyltransferase
VHSSRKAGETATACTFEAGASELVGRDGRSANESGIATWAEYWNGDTTVYVNARHRRVHYERVARDLIEHHLPTGTAAVVDYGCGDALSAHLVADACRHLFLCDSAPNVRDQLSARYAGRGNVGVIGPAEFENLPPGSVDLIVVNSVVQYLTTPEFARLLALAHGRLATGGRLVLADVIPRRVGPLQDAAELLRFARANGFLLPAAAGLVRSYFSSYRHVRERLGVLCFDEPELIAVLRQAGFEATRTYPNIGHNARRMTLVARPAGGAASH